MEPDAALRRLGAKGRRAQPPPAIAAAGGTPPNRKLEQLKKEKHNANKLDAPSAKAWERGQRFELRRIRRRSLTQPYGSRPIWGNKLGLYTSFTGSWVGYGFSNQSRNVLRGTTCGDDPSFLRRIRGTLTDGNVAPLMCGRLGGINVWGWRY